MNIHFYDKLTTNFRKILTGGGAFLTRWDRACFTAYVKWLEDERTKRIVFDAKQAKVFDDLNGFSASVPREKIKPLFDHFYLEFSQPILLNKGEPDFNDLCHSFLFYSGVSLERIVESKEITYTDYITKIVLFLEDENGEIVDRTFSLTSKGIPVVTRNTHFNSSGGDVNRYGEISTLKLPEWVGDSFIPIPALSNFEFEDKASWWMDSITSHADLLMWINAYCMAKSVRIEVAPSDLTRQQRRALERSGKIPKPWHIIKVEPKYGIKTESTGTGSGPSYQFDVAGHLRNGGHKLKNGTYVETVEWVSSHRRGLKNDIYIPATRLVEGNRKVEPAILKKYLDQKE